jgi:SRSO17 transposase
MRKRDLDRLDSELNNYIEGLLDGLGRVERREALGWYITGLLLEGDRKSIYPMASRLVENVADVESMRQRMQQAICVASWSEQVVQARLATKVDHELPGIEAFVVDDTGFPKKGVESVGVARQYSGTLGRVDTCQVAVSLHLAGEQRSACAAMRLYLPKEWTDDPDRCRKVGIPEDVQYLPKWQISLNQIDAALSAGVRRHVVLADAGYGDCNEYRAGLRERNLHYITGVQGSHVVWSPDSNPSVRPRGAGKRGQAPTRYRDDANPPLAIKELAISLDYRDVTWREGSRGKQTSRFAAVRVRSAHYHHRSVPPGEEQWLLCEWPKDAVAPTKFWFSSLPPSTSSKYLVRLAKLRWRVERDYQEMKQEVGLDHFEGRKWRGFHHHVTMCSIAHAFLALQRALFPPQDGELDSAYGQKAAPIRSTAMDWHVPTVSAEN